MQTNERLKRLGEALYSKPPDAQPNPQPQQQPPKQDSDAQPQKTVIWGTTINFEDTKESFQKFLLEFQEPGAQYPRYLKILEQIKNTEVFNININCTHLQSYNSRLYKQLTRYPTEFIGIMDLVVNSVFVDLFPDYDMGERRIQLRVFNLKEVKPMRNLSSPDIDTLIAIRGMITRTSQIIPEMKQAYFSCLVCESGVIVDLVGNQITEPGVCSHCHSKGSMSIIHNRCKFSDKQLVKLQETPDAIPEGETPHTVNLFVYDDLVDVGKPGDRVEVTGIYKGNPARANSYQRSLKSIFKTYPTSESHDKGRLGAEDHRATPDSEFYTQFNEGDTVESITLEQEEELRKLAKSGDIYETLTKSLAPSIWELDDVKKGVLSQLFGGTNKEFKTASGARFRGEINVLLCGDPGTSKSQLLSYVHKIAPRGIYTSGRGSSAVGLTAYITRDPDTHEAVLESGALVLSDRGVCCIDEFDKMSDHTRSILHEAMEQQTVSVAKAGIICSLNSRTSILASANPKESRYNPKLSVVENIQLPPTLLSRFDLIYLVLDKPNEHTDRKLARHIVSLYWERPEPAVGVLSIETLTSYISYARKHIHPVISDEASVDLVNGYVSMRKLGGGKKTITATPRQLESLVRISEAHARMRFSNVVERVDVAEALRLVKVAIQQAAIDPRTGTIDMDLITTGRSAASRGELVLLASAVRNALLEAGIPQRMEQLRQILAAQSSVEIAVADLREVLQQLVKEDIIILSGTLNNPLISIV